MARRIGFIGLGTMGFPMAVNLLAAGYNVVAYNRSSEKSLQLAAKGAEIAASPAEVARHSQEILMMLADDAAVEEVALGSQGVIMGGHQGLILINCSTISPNMNRMLVEESKQNGVEVLDAPVTGSEPQAVSGSLTFLVGGARAAFESCKPLFDVMGKKAFYLGGNGAGVFTKLANNAMVAINLLAFAEGLTLATKCGIDPELFVEVISQGGARNGMVDTKAGKMLQGDFQANFSTNLMYKDLRLAGEVAAELSTPVPVLGLVKEIIQISADQGNAAEDVCAVIKCYEQWAKVRVQKGNEPEK